MRNINKKNILFLALLSVFFSTLSFPLFAREEINSTQEIINYDNGNTHRDFLNSNEAFDVSDLNNIDTLEEDFSNEENSAQNSPIKNLIYRIILLLMIITGIFFIIKALLYRAQMRKESYFNENPNFFEGITEKFRGSISNFEGLKLKQMLALGNGQNLYLVELDGKKMLLGGTHIGGIQYVADLTEQVKSQSKISAIEAQEEKRYLSNAVFKNPEPEMQMNDFHRPYFMSGEMLTNNSQNDFEGVTQNSFKYPTVDEDPFKQTSQHMEEIEKSRENENQKINNVRKFTRKPFKRKVNFRQSLISS